MNNISNKCFSLSKSAELYFREILALCSSKKDYRSEMIYLSLCNLLFEIAELSDNSSKTKKHHSDSDDRVFKAKKYVEDNFDIFFSCQEVAAYCRISEKQLGRLFVKHENKGLLEFIHEKKLEMITKLLLRKNISHTLVAEQLGFSSAQYYGKFIRRMTGMTPEEYKNHITNS
jgi:AraC-like DNA-binding protein